MKSEEQQQRIVVRLAEQQDDLWRQCATLGNEMVIDTIGRRFFPKLDYQIEGLDAEKQYAIFLEIHQVDDFPFKFLNNKWVKMSHSKISSAESNSMAKKIQHSYGIRTGEQWMDMPVINFDNVKISGSEKCTRASQVYLRCMYKYVPVLTIQEVILNIPAAQPKFKQIATVKFDYTEFIAVRKYQNREMASLKVATNPFSKRFRKKNPPSSPLEITSPKKKQAKHKDDSFSKLETSSPQPKSEPPAATDILPSEYIELRKMEDGTFLIVGAGLLYSSKIS